jgi:hypothetical protein
MVLDIHAEKMKFDLMKSLFSTKYATHHKQTNQQVWSLIFNAAL